MVDAQEEAQCVLWLVETKSQKTLQRKHRLIYHRSPLSMSPIYAWMKKFKVTGNVKKYTWREIEYIPGILRAAKGAYVENTTLNLL
ncbi:hypothetical protein AVEN_114216-1 [Araneus ventricosus]|uniref:DUF4817 domain-containing protein n=1 Tax=Araneus ventricosus TaxID=182803 RepID=A0A4Y2P9U8_ARAVE|nr:hypothetical protein AVEN_114216-1 [Araneus ventricosus]